MDGRGRWNYDVFLTCSGDDKLCKNFTGHLHYALLEAGIKTFQDDNQLQLQLQFQRGTDSSTKLVQNSKITIIVFSRNYAASPWCLEQLVNILGCKRTLQQKVMPLFYDVDPSDVRKQIGSFAQAFAQHEKHYALEMDRVARWRVALTQAADLSGWDLRNVADGHEAKFIKEIVQQISRELNHTYLFVAMHSVGLDYRLEAMNSLLKIGLEDVRIIGICGMGGIGKTTIAKAAYNKFFHYFEGQSFIADVRENSKQPNGQVHLQERLLSDILKAGKIRLSGVDRGINVIKERLNNKRVLVVLDDVDHLDQLNALARTRDWFGRGSRIIISTRDEHLLQQLQVDGIYMAEQLSRTESLELFSWHAFGKAYPIDNYIELSKSVVGYSEGLPLALIVLGSFLYKRSITEWKSALDKLERIPQGEVQMKLRISFDSLSDDQEKNIFLDIACFFTNMDKDYVVHILDGCGFPAEIGISVLTHRCLLAINEKNKLTMHDLLRDMGREIVCEESLKKPGERSRLWYDEDVLGVLHKHTGTNAVEGLVLNLARLSELHFTSEAFAKMNHLKLLKLNYVRVTGGYGQISKELRWLCWHKFPQKFLPTDFEMGNLIAIDMRYSNLRQICKDNKCLGMLKVLNLSHSPYLTRTPHFFSLPVLEKLILKDCTSLVELHRSIGRLHRLIVINVKDCRNLRNLPRSIYQLKSLEILNLSGCSKIDELSEDIGKMESLRELMADGTMIPEVPDSIVNLKNLMTLSLCGCKGTSSSLLSSLILPLVSTRRLKRSNLLPASLAGLISLTTLALRDCNLSSDAIPQDIGELSSLKSLDLGHNNFHVLPESISNLPNLSSLTVSNCTELETLPKLPNTLLVLFANNCSSLEKISSMSNFKYPPHLHLRDCPNLVEIQGFKNLNDTRCNIHLAGCNSLSSTFKESLLEGWSQIDEALLASLPVNQVPSWFEYQNTGPSLIFEMPPTLDRPLRGFTICILYTFGGVNKPPSVVVINMTKSICLAHRSSLDAATSHQLQDHICVCHMPMVLSKCTLDAGDLVQLLVYEGLGYTVKKCGLHLVFKEDKMDFQMNSGADEYNHAFSDANTNQCWVIAKRSDVHSDKDLDAGPSKRRSNEGPPSKRLRCDLDDSRLSVDENIE